MNLHKHPQFSENIEKYSNIPFEWLHTIFYYCTFCTIAVVKNFLPFIYIIAITRS